MWGFFGRCFSQSNYDMLSGDLCGSFRLFFNQAFMHASVYPALFDFNMPSFNFNTYSQASGMDFMLNPALALYSTNRAMGLNSGLQLGSLNSGMTTIPLTNTNGNGVGNIRAGNSVKEDQYNELKSLAQALISNGSLGGRATELNNEINKGETLDEKVRNLKKALNEYKDEIKELLKDRNNNIKINGKTIPELLRQAGIGSSVEKATVDGVFEGLRSAENEQEFISGALDKYDILEIVSCYQSSDTNILQAISELDHDYKNNITTYICTRLIYKAEALANSNELSNASKEHLESLISDFRSKIKSGDEIDDAMIEAFNKLYQQTKLAAARIVDYGLQNTYGDVLDGIVPEDMYYQEAVSQLTSDYGSNLDSTKMTLDETKVNRIKDFNTRNKIDTTIQANTEDTVTEGNS